jgi:tRNA-2-methylthio-N6-dimethylallyladenosine synthase
MAPLPEAVKDERLKRLQAEIDRHQAAFMARCAGMTFDVLFEKPGRHPGQIVGRSPYLQPVQVVAPPTLIGAVVPVTVTEVAANSLFGTLTNAPRQTAPSRAAVVAAR